MNDAGKAVFVDAGARKNAAAARSATAVAIGASMTRAGKTGDICDNPDGSGGQQRQCNTQWREHDPSWKRGNIHDNSKGRWPAAIQRQQHPVARGAGKRASRLCFHILGKALRQGRIGGRSAGLSAAQK